MFSDFSGSKSRWTKRYECRIATLGSGKGGTCKMGVHCLLTSLAALRTSPLSKPITSRDVKGQTQSRTHMKTG
jgi:hypothetical protein